MTAKYLERSEIMESTSASGDLPGNREIDEIRLL